MSVARLHPEATPVPQTELTRIPQIAARLRQTFREGKTLPLDARRHRLVRMREMLVAEEARIFEALRSDLGKSDFESFGSEIAMVSTEIGHCLKKLPKWMRPKRVSTPLAHQPGKSYIVREPLGVVLIIAPWNYPIQLTLSPLVGAIAAGNCAVVKPSEIAPQSSALLAELLPKYVGEDAVQVVEGGVAETTKLLELKWDHIFYTGNGHVGRIVMRAAAENLTPVTLELGGKSPTIVDTTVDLQLAARRIAWGKFFNAGQTCTAPDYVLVTGGRGDAFTLAMKETIEAFYGADPKASPDYGRIVNERHTQRLQGLLGDGTIAAGGQVDVAARYVAPTLVRDVPLDGALMRDEIFGPILPIIDVESVEAAIEFINARDKPLALYLFTADNAVKSQVLARTSAGGTCINDTVTHVGIQTLPFGGVGESGMGAYHGRDSFDTFSHRRAVYDRATWLDVKIRYAPYGDKLKLVRKLL